MNHHICLVVVALGVVVMSCGDASEAPRVNLPVTVDASGLTPITNDLGYQVEVTGLRLAMGGLVFTVAGEADTASLWRDISEALLPTAHAHPGHFQGGEVTGELPGDFVIDWPTEEGRELGSATLIAATYKAANFTFGRGSADSLSDDDPLVGHTAILSGVATRDGQATHFTVVIDSPQGRQLIGVPFEATVGEAASGALRLRFHTLDALEGDTLFDAIDFAALDADADGELRIAPDIDEVEDAYNTIRRVFQTHDHYSVHHQE